MNNICNVPRVAIVCILAAMTFSPRPTSARDSGPPDWLIEVDDENFNQTVMNITQRQGMSVLMRLHQNGCSVCAKTDDWWDSITAYFQASPNFKFLETSCSKHGDENTKVLCKWLQYGGPEFRLWKASAQASDSAPFKPVGRSREHTLMRDMGVTHGGHLDRLSTPEFLSSSKEYFKTTLGVLRGFCNPWTLTGCDLAQVQVVLDFTSLPHANFPALLDEARERRDHLHKIVGDGGDSDDLQTSENYIRAMAEASVLKRLVALPRPPVDEVEALRERAAIAVAAAKAEATAQGGDDPAEQGQEEEDDDGPLFGDEM